MADNTFNFDLDAPAVPTLTLDPVEAPAAEEKQPEPAAAPEAEQVKLSPEEQAMVDAFAQKIDITNSQQVLQYAPPARRRSATSPRRHFPKCPPKTSAKWAA